MRRLVVLLCLCALVPVLAWAQDHDPPEIIILEPQKTRGLRVVQRDAPADDRIRVRGQVRDASRIGMVRVQGQAVTVSADGFFETMLALSVGEAIHVQAEDEHGNAAQVWVGGEGSTVQADIRGRFVALVIGIDRYGGMWSPLENAVRDARTVAHVLESDYGFDKVITLYDEAATRTAIISRIEWLGRELTVDDNLFIYYAGHGQLSETFNRGYWVPADATSNSTAEFIANAEIQTWLGGVPSKHILLVADACFAGDVFRGLKRKMRPTESTSNYYAEVHGKRSRKAMTSGGVQPVFDSGGEGHSVFARFLLDALRQNDQPYLDAQELYQKLKMPVLERTAMVQTPQYDVIENTSDQGGQFVFVRGGTGGRYGTLPDPPPLPGALLLVAPHTRTFVDINGQETIELAQGETQRMPLDPGTYRLAAVGQGLGEWTRTVTISGGTQAVVVIQPDVAAVETPSTGTLVLASQPGVALFIDEQAQPMGAHTLRAGTHAVRFVHPTYGAETVDMVVQAGKTQAHTFYFERKIAVGTITADRKAPWASLLINGERQRTTPRLLTLPPDTFTIAVERDGYEVLSDAQMLVVRPGFEEKIGKFVFEIRKKE